MSMDHKEESSSFGGIIFAIIIAILFLYVVDWSFLKGAITEYPIMCPPDYKEGNGCFTLRTSTYYPDKKKQVVIKKDEFGIQTLKKCSVIGRRNWECKWDDESGTFGFNDGQFHSITLKSNVRTFEEALEDDLQYQYVSRFRYLLEYWGIL